MHPEKVLGENSFHSFVGSNLFSIYPHFPSASFNPEGHEKSRLTRRISSPPGLPSLTAALTSARSNQQPQPSPSNQPPPSILRSPVPPYRTRTRAPFPLGFVGPTSINFCAIFWSLQLPQTGLIAPFHLFFLVENFPGVAALPAPLSHTSFSSLACIYFLHTRSLHKQPRSSLRSLASLP